MLKALFKKQMMEVNAWLIQNKKKGSLRSRSEIVTFLLLYIAIFAMLGSVFYFMGTMLCSPLCSVGLGWLYFAMMGLIAILLGVFGSVFNTYATLYMAKDNALLLSMPIPPSYFLSVRLFGVWMLGLIYEAIVFFPALLVYWIEVDSGFAAVAAGIVLMLLLSVFVLTLTCILGWVVAKISTRLRHKSIVTVVASLGFLALYYYVYFRAYEMLQTMLANAQVIGEEIKGAAYPIYIMGKAGCGDMVSLLLTALTVMVLLALTWLVLSKSFLKIATANRGEAKKRYRETKSAKRSVGGALIMKEFGRFCGSATYMLNCGLGTLMMVVAAVAVIIKGSWLREMLSQMGVPASYISMLACAAVCMLSTMNDITAPSVSLEGKNLWLVQSLPVSAWQVLKAKLYLHLLLTEIPVLLLSLCVSVSLGLGAGSTALLLTLPALFVLLCGCFGLTVNLKSPNLSWTDETVPVKQSMGVMLSLFGGWGFVIALGGLYFLLKKVFTPELYLLSAALLIAAASGGLLLWLKNRGARIFETL